MTCCTGGINGGGTFYLLDSAIISLILLILHSLDALLSSRN